jgi:hypothetical protein
MGCGGGQTTKTTSGAVFDISPAILTARVDTLVDIGVAREGEIVRYDARVRNTGSEPMVIRDIKTSCGCTTSSFDKQPIAPGATAAFSLQLNTRGMWGVQHKLVEILTSASPHPLAIALQANVEQPEYQ